MAKRHSLITIPPEINRLILELLSSHDFMALRHTSRDFYRYFASEEISHFAQKLYFPLSAESKKVRRTRFDLDCTYERSQRWKEGKPSNVTIINEVADGSASLSNGFLVDTEASLLAYQRARAIVVLKDLQCTDDSADVVIDLEKAASPCMGTRNQGIFLRDGESVRLAMNRGILLCIGEAHIHPSTNEPPQDPPGRGLSIFSSILNWGNPPPRTNIPPRQFFEHPHSACAVFSTKKEDRGRLIASWFERDSFIWMVAVNEFYAIAEFDLVEQRLEGYIYPTADSQKSMKGTSKGHGNKSDGKHDGYHFTIKKKSLYPPLSTFSVAADTRGKVFYLGFLPPSAERRPVVEVHSVPQYDPSNKSWSACTIIKRITLRSLGRHAGELNGSILNSSFWINLDQGTTVKELKGPKIEPSGPFARDPGEDIVRIRMTGDLYIPGITNTDEQQVSMVTWDITSRPSPHKPSSITEWRAGKEWEVDPDIDFDSISLYKNAEGKVDFEELYPSPTYYTRNRKREVFMTELRIIPRTLDFDCLMANNEIGVMPSLYWMKDINNKNKSACAVYCSIEPGTIVRDPKPEQPDNGGVIFAPHGEAVEFPLDPGRNDKDFVPAGIHMIAKYKVILDVGRKVTIRNTAKSKPVLPTTSASPPSPKRKSRFFGRIWTDYIYQHRASRSNNRISTTVDIMATDTIDGVSSNSSSSETVTNTTSAFTEVDLPFPGMEEHRDKILTKMDHGNKRYWVYGKEAETIDKGLPSQTRVGDKIVIVRFD